MKKVTATFADKDFRFEESYKHENGWSLDKCSPTFGVEGQRECCGYYPERYPYNWEIGRRCCYDTVYDRKNARCCAKGEIRPVC